MTSWNDCKDDEKVEAALRSLVATNLNLKNKEIFVLVCWDIMNGIYERLIVGFRIMKFFVFVR